MSPVRGRQRSDIWTEQGREGGAKGNHDHLANADYFLQENRATDFSRVCPGHRSLGHMGKSQRALQAFNRAQSVGTLGKKMKS